MSDNFEPNEFRSSAEPETRGFHTSEDSEEVSSHNRLSSRESFQIDDPSHGVLKVQTTQTFEVSNHPLNVYLSENPLLDEDARGFVSAETSHVLKSSLLLRRLCLRNFPLPLSLTHSR